MIRQCFRNLDFKILWSAGCMTGIARAMEFLALSLYALQELGLPYLVTIIFAARMLPMSLLGIVIGTISERVSPISVIKFEISTGLVFFLIGWVLGVALIRQGRRKIVQINKIAKDK